MMIISHKQISEQVDTDAYLHLMASAMPEGYDKKEVYDELNNLVEFYQKPMFNCDFVRACKFYSELRPLFGQNIPYEEFEQIFGDARFLCNIPTFRGKYLNNIIFDPLSAMMFGICRVMENKK